jgi:hypothetical protein
MGWQASECGKFSDLTVLRHRIYVMPICIQEKAKSVPSTDAQLPNVSRCYQSQQGAIFFGKLGNRGLFSTFLSNARTGS